MYFIVDSGNIKFHLQDSLINDFIHLKYLRYFK